MRNWQATTQDTCLTSKFILVCKPSIPTMSKSTKKQQGFGADAYVAQAIAKMRNGARSRMKHKNKSLEIGTNAELRQTQNLLNNLDTLILPALQDIVQASLSSNTRQDQTRPERCLNLQIDSEDPSDNPYAAVVVSQSLNLTTSITKLCESTVIIVGLNGTGAKLATLLARRGLGNLIVMDPFNVSKNEWHHTLEFTPSMEGLSKARAVCGLIAELNADTRVEAICCDVRDSNGSSILAHCMKTSSMVVPSNYNARDDGASDGTKGNDIGKLKSMEMYSLDVDVHLESTRQINKHITYINKLPIKTINFDALGSPPIDTDVIHLPAHTLKKDIIVACCDDDPYARTIVGEFAMEFGLTALYSSIGNDNTNFLVPSSKTVVPGVTACLQCHQKSKLVTNNNSTIPSRPTLKKQVLTNICSSATHAIMASTLCQAALRSFLSNANTRSSIDTEWHEDRDMIEANKPSKAYRKCFSHFCQAQQINHRKRLTKTKMRKVLKIGNMFAWTKKKNEKVHNAQTTPINP